MRWLFGVMAVILALLQFQLWVGKGSLAEVSDLRRKNERLRRELVRLQRQNARLAAEVKDLKSGTEAVEERARDELGMVREGETFFLMVEPGPGATDDE